MKRKEKQLSCKSKTKNWEKFCYLCCQYRNISKYYIDYYIIIIISKFNKILYQGNII